jgi:type IX secretion system PorP/SprF family membrane protein
MNHKKPLTILFFFLVFVVHLHSQQKSQWSSYYENGFVWNPALTARWNSWEVSTTYRKEWTGFIGAPESATIGFQYPVIRSFTKMTFGAFIDVERLGPYQSSTIALTYAYKIKPRLFGKRDDVLSFGIKAGGSKYNFNPSNLVAYDALEGDLNLLPSQSGINPLVGGGISYSSVSDFYSFKSHYYGGIAFDHVIPNSYKTILDQSIKSVPHIYLHVGYRYFPWRAKYYFEPNAFASYAFNKAINVMANCRFEMVEKFWLSAGAVSNGEVFIQTGVIFNRKSALGSIVKDGLLRVGIKTDYSLNSLGKYGGIGYEFYMSYVMSNEPY